MLVWGHEFWVLQRRDGILEHLMRLQVLAIQEYDIIVQVSHGSESFFPIFPMLISCQVYISRAASKALFGSFAGLAGSDETVTCACSYLRLKSGHMRPGLMR